MSQATLSDRPYVNSDLFSGHYLDERVTERDEWDCDDAARETMEKLQSLYQLEGSLVEAYGEDALVDNWIDEVLDMLGFGTQEEVTLPDGGGFVDELLFETPKTRRDAAEVYLQTEDSTDLFTRGIGIVEAKQWDATFDVRFAEQRPYRNASHQTKHYLENTTQNIQWGVLTNGRKWRLYGTNDYETQTYYEVDLPELLARGDLEAFKYFYVFFRSDAFHLSGETTFHDEVWSESETASQELGDNLQDNVFTALRVLGRGFVESNEDLNIDPDDEEALSELKEQSLVFLYRLMFVLYAESRGLIHPSDQNKQAEYDQSFSLDELRLNIHDTIGEVDDGFGNKFSDFSTTMWSRLEDLFRLIDKGEEELGIPAYNGGLFDHEGNEFLTDHKVTDQYLAEVIYRLSTTENDEGRYVLADYADLDTRHLGSVYEGLLEHQFRIAPEQYAAVAEDGGQVWKSATEVSIANAAETVPQGALYVVNDEGERKATGAYYTPDHIVTYIIEETVGPLIEEIRKDLINQGFEPGTQEYIGPFYRRVTNLRILDPAMGSGHFLTKTTGYLSEQVMSEVRKAETDYGVSFNEQHIRREIAKECIYGVDLNGMAVELAKLSMWLETLAADRPLAFLDHRFKHGNSLVGSDITAVLSDDAKHNGGQLTLTQSFAQARQQTLGHVMELMTDLLAIDNNELSDIKSMEVLYDEIQNDPLYKRLFEVANVHTAEQFGIDVPEKVYENMAEAIDDDNKWAEIRNKSWFIEAQTLTDEQNFFHWELEYPEVFFDEEGQKLDGSGFDAVVGNPPYGMLQPNNTLETFLEYLNETYVASEFKIDLYVLFTERTVELTKRDGSYGLILPNTFILNTYAEEIRNILLSETSLEKLLVSDDYLFEDADVHNAIVIGENNKKRDENQQINVVWKLDQQYLSGQKSASRSIKKIINKNDLDYTGDGSWNVRLSNDLIPIFDKVKSTSEELVNISEVNRGLITGNSDEYISKEQKGSEWLPMIAGGDVDRYNVEEPAKYVLFDRPSSAGGCWDRDVHFEKNKILIRQIGTYPRAGIDTVGNCFTGNVFSVIGNSDLDSHAILGIINSSLIKNIWLILYQDFKRSFTELKGTHIEEIPISSNLKNNPTQALLDEINHLIDETTTTTYSDCLSSGAKYISSLIEKRNKLNLSLLDHLRSYDNGASLSEIGLTQPPRGAADSILQQTATEKPNLRVGQANVVRESDTSVEIQLTARYKPEDEDAYETDRWGYTETNFNSALRVTNLSPIAADLISAFIPVTVDEAGGFADFRKNATKTNSLVDRLEAITLPDLDDVIDDLERYTETVERADELDEKIQRTDDLIDEIVYELYGLTDEEIKIVEEAVSGD